MGMQTGAAQAATPRADDASQGHVTGYGTPGYRSYVLNALLIIYILSFMDRALLSVVARPLKAEIGSLDKVRRIVKVLGMVNSMPDFGQQPEVINGFSDLMVKVFGDERGKHARSAVGMVALPRNISVEIEMVVEVEP